MAKLKHCKAAAIIIGFMPHDHKTVHTVHNTSQSRQHSLKEKSYSSLLLLSGHNPEQFNRLPNMCCHGRLSFSFCLCTPHPDKGSTGLGHWAWLLGWTWTWWSGQRVIGSLSTKPIQETMTYLNIFPHYKPDDHSWTELKLSLPWRCKVAQWSFWF